MELFEQYGLVDQEFSFETRYNEPSRTLIKQTGAKKANGFIKSLFYRQLNQEKYSLLAGGSDEASYEDMIVSSDTPLVYANLERVEESNAGDQTRLIHEWDSLVRIDLISRKEDCVVSESVLNKDYGDEVNIWISQLLSLGINDESLTFIFGSMPKSGSHREVTYRLGRYIFSTGRIETLSNLSDPLF